MTYTKCDTKDTLCDDPNNTCATVLETLEMCVIHVYMVRKTHLHKGYPLKPSKLHFVHCATLHILKDDSLIFLQMRQGDLEKTHAITLNVCDDSMESKIRL